MVRFVHPNFSGLSVLYIGFLAFGAPIAMAGEPCCDVTGTCLEASDTCTPVTGNSKIPDLPTSKHQVLYRGQCVEG